MPEDDAHAAQLYERACTAGDATGCSNLGLAYVQGSGVPVDAARGLVLLRQACAGGRETACRNAAILEQAQE